MILLFLFGVYFVELSWCYLDNIILGDNGTGVLLDDLLCYYFFDIKSW